MSSQEEYQCDNTPHASDFSPDDQRALLKVKYDIASRIGTDLLDAYPDQPIINDQRILFTKFLEHILPKINFKDQEQAMWAQKTAAKLDVLLKTDDRFQGVVRFYRGSSSAPQETREKVALRILRPN